MTQFRKIVYIDSDVVALRAPDELFDVQEDFAAAPDVGWPDAFNTGVMVLAPRMGDYYALRTLAGAGDSFDGADQGLLNQFFEHKPWKRLSFVYNCTPSANYQYEPAYRYYKRDISMVHFIGSGKPWKQGRSVHRASGAYQELLSRWWAVYDRHFRVSTTNYALGQRDSIPHVVQQEVKGEAENGGHGYYATGYPADSTSPDAPQYQPPPEASAVTTEAPFTERGEHAENIDQGIIQPQPTSEVRRFSAPHMEWDATQSAPPVESKPEAVNFPTEVYEFSEDPTPFRPPPSYPEPPREQLWYEVPKQPSKKEAKPPPIFPWEEREMPRPTRKFVEDSPPLPPPPTENEREPDFGASDEFSVQSDLEPATPTIKLNDKMPWDAFGAVNKNAWDEVSGIEDYVRALTAFQKNRGKVQVLPTQAQLQAQQQHILSPTNEPNAEDLVEKVQRRRESLILTDFPTAIERPSLPVTPAPVRRTTFWGLERDEEGDLPGAEGVPDQADWDPNAQLEQLRRNSLLGPSDLKLTSRKSIPDRKMPMPMAAAVPEEAVMQSHVPLSDAATPQGLDVRDAHVPEGLPLLVGGEEAAKVKTAVAFSEPSFEPTDAPGGAEVERVEVVSPTEV